MARPSFAFAPAGADPAHTVYVDGVEAGYRSLSHWPGNSTPAAFRHDLSTGIALTWARARPAERTAALGDFDLVANNHYDTDGALSVFAVLRPEEALPRAERMLAAAATGDFGTWQGPDALALDLLVMSLPRHPRSPVTAGWPADASDARRWEASYAWLVDRLPQLLDEPGAWPELWADEHAALLAEVEAVQAGRGLSVARWPAEELAAVTSARPLSSLGLNLAAGDAYRVLLVRPEGETRRFRFRYRDESWFELVSRRPLPRVALGPVAEALDRAEGGWWADDIRAPVAELGFGRRPEHRGVFDDPDLSGDRASRLSTEVVVAALRAAWGRAGT